MPLTPTERRNLAAITKAPIVTDLRTYVIKQQSRACSHGHYTGAVLLTPPTCGKCTVKIARNRVEEGVLVTQAKQAARDYADEQNRKALSDAKDGVRTANWKREATDTGLDQDEVVAAYAAITQSETKRYADGRGEQEYRYDPMHRFDLAWKDPQSERTHSFADGTNALIQSVTEYVHRTYWMQYATDLRWCPEDRTLGLYAECKYCNWRNYRYGTGYIGPDSVGDQDWTLNNLTHYYECRSIQNFQRKAQRDADKAAGRNLNKATYKNIARDSDGNVLRVTAQFA